MDWIDWLILPSNSNPFHSRFQTFLLTKVLVRKVFLTKKFDSFTQFLANSGIFHMGLRPKWAIRGAQIWLYLCQLFVFIYIFPYLSNYFHIHFLYKSKNRKLPYVYPSPLQLNLYLLQKSRLWNTFVLHQYYCTNFLDLEN